MQVLTFQSYKHAQLKKYYKNQHTVKLSNCHDADKWDMCMCHHHHRHHQVPIQVLAQLIQKHKVPCLVYEDCR